MSKGYRNYVSVYDEKIYVNTHTGEGIDRVIQKIDPLLTKIAKKIYIQGYLFEDIKGELIILSIDGIKSFDPERGIKLSTFLQTHLRNKVNSWIKNENKLSADAFYLFQDKKDNSGVRQELSFNQFDALNEEDGFLFENTISDDGGLFSQPISNYDTLSFECDLLKATSKLDPKIKKIVELIYFKDFSIQDAANEVGISGQVASIKLQKLAKKGYFKSIFYNLK